MLYKLFRMIADRSYLHLHDGERKPIAFNCSNTSILSYFYNVWHISIVEVLQYFSKLLVRPFLFPYYKAKWAVPARDY